MVVFRMKILKTMFYTLYQKFVHFRFATTFSDKHKENALTDYFNTGMINWPKISLFFNAKSIL